MTIYDQHKQPIAVVEPRIIGTPFLFGLSGPDDISLRGFTLAIEPGEFVRAMRGGETYLIEDHGEHWRLHRVVLRGSCGMVVHPETLDMHKEGSAA